YSSGPLERYSGNASLLELARQRTPMHAEAARGFGDVEVGLDQHLVDTLPFERLERGRPIRDRGAYISLRAIEGCLDIVGVGRLDEIVRGTELDRLHRGGDARVPGEHNDEGRRSVLVKGLHAHQPRGRAELEVDHGIAWSLARKQARKPIEIMDLRNPVAAPFERTLQGGGELGVVLDDDEEGLLIRHLGSFR